MFKSAVYHGNCLVGEADVYTKLPKPGTWAREIRISHLSPLSDRCPPLAVLHTIAPGGPLFKMECRLPALSSGESPPLLSLYATCLRENKTAVVPLGEEELHLVAMVSREDPMHEACFWAFNVVPGMYNSCLVMLNLRCLGIVFDLDETLIVANTMRSFEDKIDALQRKISNEVDQQRVNCMLAEIKRYQDDKAILKQYIENNHIIDNGRVYEVQSEVIPPLTDRHQPIMRPIIRLPEKNIILTRVNPAMRDTSVIVRLRPAWEDLRSYLTARGRKRFEVYVCTMAERDYALEMWRLLDPEANLINSRELLDRIVCVKSGTKKSLLGVFHDGICHPKMALVIDDRLKVWDEKDQPRVHVVPAFAPYYAPQAEANNSVPVLCVARNVACNVRGVFFKEFDESLLPRIASVYYEDEMETFPSAPDVGNYLVTEDDTSALNGNKDPVCNEGMLEFDIERQLTDASCSKAVPPVVNNIDSWPISFLHRDTSSSLGTVPQAASQVMTLVPTSQYSQPIVSCRTLGQSGLLEPSMQSSPAREEGEVPESELDPDTRRRLLIMQHGQDTRDTPPPPPLPPPPFSVRPPSIQVSVPPVQSRGTWFPREKEINPRQLKRAPKDFPLEPEPIRFDRNKPHHPPYFHGGENFIPSERLLHENQRLPVQVHHGDDRLHLNPATSNYGSYPGDETRVVWPLSNYSDIPMEFGRTIAQYEDTPCSVLLEIATKLGSKVEFRTSLCDSAQLRFSVEVWFVGEKIGEGIGRSKKEVQHLACERALQNLASWYLSTGLHDPNSLHGDKFFHINENSFTNDLNAFGYPSSTKDDLLPITNTLEESHILDQRLEGSRRTIASVSTLKELCIMEGYDLVFRADPSPSLNSVSNGDVYAQDSHLYIKPCILKKKHGLILHVLIKNTTVYTCLAGHIKVGAKVEIAGQILGKGAGTKWEEAKLQAAKEALDTLKSMPGQFIQKRLGSPRSLSELPNKRLKQDFLRVLQRIPSSGRYQKNETPVP